MPVCAFFLAHYTWPQQCFVFLQVVSKGRVLKAGRVQRTDLTSVNLPFSVDMVPALRLVAYYYSQAGRIVADSVWVNVKDVCKGKVAEPIVVLV